MIVQRFRGLCNGLGVVDGSLEPAVRDLSLLIIVDADSRQSEITREHSVAAAQRKYDLRRDQRL